MLQVVDPARLRRYTACYMSYMLLAALLFGGVCLIALVMAVLILCPYRERRSSAPPPEHQVLTFTPPSGVRLHAWLLPNRGRTIVLLHGRNGNKSQYVECATRLHGMGYQVLLLDQRAHGESSGVIHTFGVREREDVAYVLDAFGEPDVILLGFSLGAAVSLQMLEHPCVAAAIADSPFADLPSVLHWRRSQLRIPHWPFAPLSHCFVRWLAGFDVQQVSPLEIASRTDKPVLLIHGGR
ncbi:MAG: alpha/beta hydrolase, partial [Candidatus Xenobia bacterium]